MDGLGTGIANALAAGMQGATSGLARGMQLAETKRDNLRKQKEYEYKVNSRLPAEEALAYTRQQARQKARENNYRLEQLRYKQATRLPEDLVAQQQALLAQQLKQTQAQLAKQSTFSAFDRYEADGDVRHLNSVIKNTPMLKELYSNVARIQPLHPNDPDDAKIMQSLGLTEPSKRYLKVIKSDGSVDYMDMFKVYQGTGYASYVDNRTLDRLIKEHQLSGKQYAPSAYGKFVEDYKRYHPNATQEEIDRAYGSREQTAKQKDLQAAEDATKDLVNKFGGEDQFFKTNFSKRENLTKAYSDLVKIEKLEGVEFTSQEKKKLENIRSLIALGEPGKNLTAAETGLIDSQLTNLRKYISDNVKGVDATSAYHAFRNSVRHALYGSALTDSEIKSFNDAFGTLSNQLGPVLQQFKTSLSQVKAELESVATMKNPYSAHIRLGADKSKLNSIIRAIDERLQYIQKAENKKEGKKPTKRKPLEDIL